MKVKDFKKTTFLSGPTSITRLKSEKYDKDIYLIGDIHSSKARMCAKSNIEVKSEFLAYMDTFLKLNKDKDFFDYMAEVPFHSSIRENIMNNPGPSNSVMSDIFNHFKSKGCFSFEKESMKKCKKEYPNARFHMTDFRDNRGEYKIKNSEMKNMLFMGYQVFYDIFYFALSDYYGDSYDFFMNKQFKSEYYINGLEMFSSKTIFKKKLKELYESKIMKSQLNKVNKKVSDKIHKIIKKEQKRIFKIIDNEKYFFNDMKKTLSIIKMKKIEAKDVDLMKTMRRKRGTLFFASSLTAHIIDIFVLTRLFKKFNDKKHPYMKKVFIHMGEFHISFIREALIKAFGFKEVEHTGFRSDYLDIPREKHKQSFSRCLNMKYMTMPFFK